MVFTVIFKSGEVASEKLNDSSARKDLEKVERAREIQMIRCCTEIKNLENGYNNSQDSWLT